MAEILTIDIEKVAQNALKDAQFGFPFKPVSTNNLTIPVIRQFNGRPTAVKVPSGEATVFKTNLLRSIQKQVRMIQSPANGWECLTRYYSVWIIANNRSKQMLALDINNIDKAIVDTFVDAGVVPDDKKMIDCRALYGDFNAAELPDAFLFAVLIRWGDHFALV